MRRLLSLFRSNDRIILAVILVLSVTAGRLPEIFDSRYPYPTTLYSIFGTIAQSLSPVLAVALFFLLYKRGGGENPYRQDLLKGAFLLGVVVLLALALMPFSELIYGVPGVRQGIVAGITLMGVWSLGQTILSVARMLMDDRVEG